MSYCYNSYRSYRYAIEQRAEEIISSAKDRLNLDLEPYKERMIIGNPDVLSFTYLGPGQFEFTSTAVQHGEKLILPTDDPKLKNKYNCVLEYQYWGYEPQHLYFLSDKIWVPEQLAENKSLLSRKVEINLGDLNEKIRKATEELIAEKSKAEEFLIRNILRNILKREPGEEEFKKTMRVFGLNKIGEPEKYALVFNGVTLGTVVTEIIPDEIKLNQMK